MHPQGVFVVVKHPKFGIAKGSGIQINNIVITHGSVLEPICFSENDQVDILKRYNSIVKELQSEHCNIKFEVIHKNNCEYDFIIKDEHDLTNHFCSSEDSLLEEAKFVMFHNYVGMWDISREISNWSNDSDNNCQHQQLDYLLLPKFIFLTIGKSTEISFEEHLQTVSNKLKCTIIYPGLPIVVESTPFCNYSFFNSWSRGIISKVIGSANDGIITDARLVIGCEGAPIYSFENEAKGNLIGIVVHTISLCNGEWNGFSLGLSIKHLIKSVLGLQSTIDYIPFKKFNENWPSPLINVDRLADSVVFVRCHHKWGSGVVIDEEAGLILTCAHVIQHDHNAISVVCGGGKVHAVVVYASPSSTPYDLAVLSIGKVSGLKKLKLADTSPVLGERVMAVGYPLSTESLVTLNRTPTLSAGCVSKVSRRGGPLHTTCCTQSGLSGGALVRLPDQLLGIVVSNVRLDTTTIPCFSFAVSVENFREPITQYLNTKDPSYLKPLCQECSYVKMEWSLTDCKL